MLSLRSVRAKEIPRNIGPFGKSLVGNCLTVAVTPAVRSWILEGVSKEVKKTTTIEVV